jgi:hypothetical protein
MSEEAKTRPLVGTTVLLYNAENEILWVNVRVLMVRVSGRCRVDT